MDSNESRLLLTPSKNGSAMVAFYLVAKLIASNILRQTPENSSKRYAKVRAGMDHGDLTERIDHELPSVALFRDTHPTFQPFRPQLQLVQKNLQHP